MMHQGVSQTIKRLVDIVFASILLAVAAPVLAYIAIKVRRKLGTPVLFRQSRPGLHGKPFEMIKFRSMRTARKREVESLTDAERLTDYGRFLRRTSLDELPELWCVLKGDMSLVGPRPLLIQYLPYYHDHERIRFSVKPGITGWAQVNGRNHSSWDQRLEDDLWYVENWTIWLDIRILWRTLLGLIKRRGVVVDARSAMLNFDEERSKDIWTS